MSSRIAIIGAGWYGCHLGSSLAALGFEVKVFERHRRPLHEASGNNQFRLHLGFHYARHHGTRLQSRDGFQRFIERYPGLSAPVADNLYAVPRGTSLIDFPTYKLIMASSGIDFVELPDGHPRLAGIEGAMLTRERVLLTGQARQWFTHRLGTALELGHPVRTVVRTDRHVRVDGERFDYAIDATWGHHAPLPVEVRYEPTLLLYYETREAFPAVTLVDGPLASIYPTEDPGIYTLSSVAHTPLGRVASAAAARRVRDAVSAELVAARRRAMEAQIAANVPGFRDAFRFAGVQLAIKTKPLGSADDRSCYVFRNGRIFSVLSGKIDTVFVATERVLAALEAESAGAPVRRAGPRQELLLPAA